MTTPPLDRDDVAATGGTDRPATTAAAGTWTARMLADLQARGVRYVAPAGVDGWGAAEPERVDIVVEAASGAGVARAVQASARALGAGLVQAGPRARGGWSFVLVRPMADGAAWLWLDVSTARSRFGRPTAGTEGQGGAVAVRRAALDRWLRPAGLWVAVYGPDGVGKSSVIEALTVGRSPAFRGMRRYHLRPHLGRRASAEAPAVTDPHGRPRRGWAPSLVKLAYWWWDATAGYWLRVRGQLADADLVVFDRYVDDLAVDPRRYRYGGPAWAVAWLRACTPRPDLTVVLDAPAELLQARKREVTAAESARQRAAYRSLPTRRDASVVLDASRPLPEVVWALDAAVLAHLERRTARRVGTA